MQPRKDCVVADTLLHDVEIRMCVRQSVAENAHPSVSCWREGGEASTQMAEPGVYGRGKISQAYQVEDNGNTGEAGRRLAIGVLSPKKFPKIWRAPESKALFLCLGNVA